MAVPHAHEKPLIRRRSPSPKVRKSVRDSLLLKDFSAGKSSGCCTALKLFGDAACRMTPWGKMWMLLKIVSSIIQVELILWNMTSLRGTITGVFVPDAEDKLKTSDERWEEYYSILGQIGLYVLFYGLQRSLMVYSIEGLRLNFRTYLTKSLMDRYFTINNFYHLTNQPELDNPGVRICDDVDEYTNNMTHLIDEQFARLYMVIRLGITILGKESCLMWLFAYWFGAFVLLVCCTPMFIRAIKMVLKRNAILREGMVQIQEYAENIAFCEAGDHEEHWALARLHYVVDSLWSKAHRSAVLDTIVQTASEVGNYMPYVLLAGKYLVSTEEFSGLKEAAKMLADATGANELLKDALLTFFKGDNMQAMGNLFGPAKRIEELNKFFEYHEDVMRQQKPSIKHGHAALNLSKVSVTAPDGRQLAQKLDFMVNPGDSVMICGPSGVGKSSLMRVLCGLWTPDRGTVSLPNKNEIMFLPQQVYIPAMPRKDNTLRNQILFPHTLAAVDDRTIVKALERVNLGHLMKSKGVHTTADWRKRLSGGERQRIAIARLLVAKPRMAFLDEATSALDPENQRRLFDSLQTSGATYITVSHKESLRKYHSHILELQPGGGYSFYKCEEFAGQKRNRSSSRSKSTRSSPRRTGRSRSRSRKRQ